MFSREHELYLTTDCGHVDGPGTRDLVGHQLAGSALGVRGMLWRLFNYDLSAGLPLYKPQGFHTSGATASYRLIFSRTHGELRVVSELARSYSTEPGQSRGSGGIRLWVTVRCALWLLGLALFAGPALADGIVADVTAAPCQRPEVIATQNILPQVNITAPN